MKLVFSIILISFAFFGISAAQQPVTLTVEKSVELALERNISVIQARNTLDAAQSSEQAAIGGLLPTLGANGSYYQSQNWSPTGTQLIQGIPIPVTSGGFSRRESYSAGISSDVTLFNGFANYANINRSKSDANSSEYNLTRVQQTAVNQTHQLFLNIFRTYKLMTVSEDNLKQSQRQLERIVESNKVGAVALADVYRQQVQVGTNELSLINAQSNHEKAKADLIAYLGIDFGGEYKFEFSGIPEDVDTTEFTAVNAQYSDYEKLVSAALEKRPDFQAAIEDLNGRDAMVTAARAGYMPVVRASGSYGYNNDALSRITDNKNLSLSLSVSLPIFNGFSTKDQLEQAQVQRKNADELVRQTSRQVRVDVRKALLDLEASEKQIAVTKSSVVSAEMDKKIAEEKYNLGAGTLLDLLVANANYTTVLSNKVNAVTGYLLSKKQVEYATGTIAK